MVTIKQIAERTGLDEDEIREILTKRGVSPHKGEKYSGLDLERVNDENFKVREANAPILSP